MAELRDLITGFVKVLKGAPTERLTYFPIGADRVVGGPAQPTTALADKHYFEVTVTETFLRDKREYSVTYLPVVLMLSRFSFDHADREVPFLVNNDLLKSIEDKIDGQSVEFRNTTVLGPVPYMGGKLNIFIGLFRAKNEDLVSKYVDAINDLAKVFPIGDLTNYLQLLKPLKKGVEGVLGIKNLDMRLGFRDEFDTITAGYAVCINLPDKRTEKRRSQFWVQKNQLWVGEGQPAERFAEADYCLLQFKVADERPYAGLSFSPMWNEIKDLVWKGQIKLAQSQFQTMGRQMAVSPDLTTSHRYNLIRIYKANLEQEIELYNSTKASTEPQSKERGGERAAEKAAGGKAALQLLDGKDAEAKSPQLLGGVRRLVTAWDAVVQPREGREKLALSDELIGAQLRALQKHDGQIVDPKKFMEFLTNET